MKLEGRSGLVKFGGRCGLRLSTIYLAAQAAIHPTRRAAVRAVVGADIIYPTGGTSGDRPSSTTDA